MAKYSVLAVLTGHQRFLMQTLEQLEDTYHWDRTDEEELQRQVTLNIYRSNLDWTERLIDGIKTGELCLKRGAEDKKYLDIIS